MYCNTVNILNGMAEVFILSIRDYATIFSYKFHFLLCVAKNRLLLLYQLLCLLKHCKSCSHAVVIGNPQGLANITHHEISKVYSTELHSRIY